MYQYGSRFPYFCSYLQKDGIICGNPCTREYCYLHFRKNLNRPCLKCKKLTKSKYNMCKICSVNERGKTYYKRKKDNKIK